MIINEILEEIYTKGSIYDEIIDNIIGEKNQLKSELLSEISLYYLLNKEKIEDVYNKGYFKYYFINTVKNQFWSNTSSFHKNIRIPNNKEISDIKYDIIEDNTSIEEKIHLEERIDNLQIIKSNCGMTWFESQMLREYFDHNKTYRKIEDEYGLDHCLVFKTVKTTLQKMIDYSQNN